MSPINPLRAKCYVSKQKASEMQIGVFSSRRGLDIETLPVSKEASTPWVYLFFETVELDSASPFLNSLAFIAPSCQPAL